jgi:1,4-dihydroxy-2-naphthoate octaprenyltransferase
MSSPRDPLVLEADDPRARAALLTGWLERGPERVRVVADEVLDIPTRTIAFRPIDGPRPPKLFVYAASLRAVSLTATALPGLVIFFLGIAAGLKADAFAFALALTGAVLLQVGVNILNDVEDHLKLIDLPGGAGGSQTLQRGWVSALELRRLGWASLVLGAALGTPIVIQHWRVLLPLGAVAFLGSLGYSSRPFGFKYRALGDLDVLLLCGPLLTIGFSWAAFGAMIPGTLALGLFFGLLACGILHVNNIQDIPLDSSRGARTLASELGFGRSVKVLYAYYLCAYLCLGLAVVLEHVPGSVFGALVAVPLLVSLLAACTRASGPHSPALVGLRVRAAQVHLLAGLGIVMAVGASILL